MIIKKEVLFLLLFSFVQLMVAQEFNVKSFKVVENDISAIRFEQQDVSGEKCAIIKVFTNVEGAFYDTGFGIEHKEVKSQGEVWLWVSPQEKRLKVRKAGFMPLDYDIATNILPSKVYRIQIKGMSADGDMLIEELTQWLVLETEPSGADVYFNDEYLGITPLQKKLELGEYSYRIQKTMYHDFVGTVELKQNAKAKLSYKLKPKYGFVEVTSSPEVGASIEIDGIPVPDSKTPYNSKALLSGTHQLTLKKKDYQPTSISFTLGDDERKKLVVKMKPNFAVVSIETLPNASIFIDDKKKGKGKYSGRLEPGVHVFEASLENHKTHRVQKSIVIGQRFALKLNPQQKTGNIDIISEPFGASVWIKGENKGETPMSLKNIAVGMHELLLKKKGYGNTIVSVRVTEKETISKNVKLNNAKQIEFLYAFPQYPKLEKNLKSSVVDGKKTNRSMAYSNFMVGVNRKYYLGPLQMEKMVDYDYLCNVLYGYPRVTEEESRAITRKRFWANIPEGTQAVDVISKGRWVTFRSDLQSLPQNEFYIYMHDPEKAKGKTLTKIDNQILIPCGGTEYMSTKERYYSSEFVVADKMSIAQNMAYQKAVTALAGMINAEVTSEQRELKALQKAVYLADNTKVIPRSVTVKVDQYKLKGITLECSEIERFNGKYRAFVSVSISREDAMKSITGQKK